jgi:hypothetical protein
MKLDDVDFSLTFNNFDTNEIQLAQVGIKSNK